MLSSLERREIGCFSHNNIEYDKPYAFEIINDIYNLQVQHEYLQFELLTANVYASLHRLHLGGLDDQPPVVKDSLLQLLPLQRLVV